jgi:hypothetical protein
MRRAFVALVLAACSACAVLAPASGAGGGTGIRGVVLNATCYGPCRYPPPPPSPYTGTGLGVKVRSLPTNELVARLHPADGRFAVKLSPGWYRLKARVDQAPPCWRGEARRAQVADGQLTRVRLRVANECIR